MKHLLFFFCFFVFQSFAQEQIVVDLKNTSNKKTKTTFIKKISSIKAGVVLDSIIIEQDIKHIKRVPSVAHAYNQVLIV